MSTKSLTPQNRMILEYLQTRQYLSNQIAINSLGVGTLSKRIAELRALGHDIKSEWAEDFHGKRYVKYSLNKEKAEA